MMHTTRTLPLVMILAGLTVAGCDKKDDASTDVKAGPAQAGVAAPSPGAAADSDKAPAARTQAGGNGVEKSADGTIRARNAEGAQAVVRPDGSVEAKAADGTKATVQAKGDGSTDVRSDKGSVKTDGSGNTKVMGPDGQKVEVGADGSVKVSGVNVGN